MSVAFDHSTLCITPRSPFARRVRVALFEHQIAFDEKVFDVFNPTPELIKLNPLARIPAIIFADGRVLVDSTYILDVFYDGRSSPLGSRNDEERLAMAEWSALALGICEKSVEYYLETVRPEARRDPEVLSEDSAIFERTVARFEEFLAKANRATILPDRFTQADIDMGVALAYLTLRYSADWKRKYPHAGRYFSAIDERPSFAGTRPPA